MDAQKLIRDAGLRVTRQRVAVFDAVAYRPHVSAATVLADIAAALPDVSHQAVYDCLAHLTEAGLLRRFIIDGGPMLYETRTRDNHHHFVCRNCKVVVDVDCAIGAAPCLDTKLDEGFLIDEAEVTYRGFCADCVAARPTPPARPELKPERRK
jgi:Fe2+ or Zn2+ uptake regulation protein